MNLRETYDAVAVARGRWRSRALIERRWLERFLALAPEGAVLDLGCGTGEPISAYLAAAGRRVTSVDFSEAMLGVARARRP